jgi:hypothetical protein
VSRIAAHIKYAHATQLRERPAVLFLYTYFNRTRAPRTAARVHHNAKIASRRVVPDGLTGILPPVKLHTEEPFTETSSTRSSKTNMSSQQALSMNSQSRAMVKRIRESTTVRLWLALVCDTE